MKCDYNSCTIKACIPPYNSSEKRQKPTFHLNMAVPINVIKYGAILTCFRILRIPGSARFIRIKVLKVLKTGFEEH